jgi:antitoxin CptB
MERNRLFWASRRGMLELDLVLLPFLDNVYETLGDEDKKRYWKLLDGEDQDMFNWFINRHVPEDPEIKIIVDIIRANTGMQVTP